MGEKKSFLKRSWKKISLGFGAIFLLLLASSVLLIANGAAPRFVKTVSDISDVIPYNAKSVVMTHHAKDQLGKLLESGLGKVLLSSNAIHDMIRTSDGGEVNYLQKMVDKLGGFSALLDYIDNEAAIVHIGKDLLLAVKLSGQQQTFLSMARSLNNLKLVNFNLEDIFINNVPLYQLTYNKMKAYLLFLGGYFFFSRDPNIIENVTHLGTKQPFKTLKEHLPEFKQALSNAGSPDFPPIVYFNADPNVEKLPKMDDQTGITSRLAKLVAAFNNAFVKYIAMNISVAKDNVFNLNSKIYFKITDGNKDLTKVFEQPLSNTSKISYKGSDDNTVIETSINGLISKNLADFFIDYMYADQKEKERINGNLKKVEDSIIKYPFRKLVSDSLDGEIKLVFHGGSYMDNVFFPNISVIMPFKGMTNAKLLEIGKNFFNIFNSSPVEKEGIYTIESFGTPKEEDGGVGEPEKKLTEFSPSVTAKDGKLIFSANYDSLKSILSAAGGPGEAVSNHISIKVNPKTLGKEMIQYLTLMAEKSDYYAYQDLKDRYVPLAQQLKDFDFLTGGFVVKKDVMEGTLSLKVK